MSYTFIEECSSGNRVGINFKKNAECIQVEKVCKLFFYCRVPPKFSSAQSCPALCDPVNHSTPGLLVHRQQPEFIQTHPLSRWCHPTISSSVLLFSYPQSSPASGSFQVSQLFASGGQNTGVSASTSVLPTNTRDWSPFRMDWLDLFAVQGTLKSLLQHHSSMLQVFSAQLSSQSNSHIHTWPQEKP